MVYFAGSTHDPLRLYTVYFHLQRSTSPVVISVESIVAVFSLYRIRLKLDTEPLYFFYKSFLLRDVQLYYIQRVPRVKGHAHSNFKSESMYVWWEKNERKVFC